MRTRPKARTPILAALPAHLRKAEAPDDEHVYEQWSQARTYWLRDNGFTALELLRAERPMRPPSKKRSENVRTSGNQRKKEGTAP